VVPILNLAGTSLNYHQVIERNTLETYAADSGVEYALCKLGNDPEVYQVVNLQESFIVNDRTVDVTAEYLGDNIYKITSIATTDSNSSTTIESYVFIIIGLFDNGIASNSDLNIQNTLVDGDIYANGNIILQNSNVDGDAYATGTILGKSQVTGDIIEGGEPLDFPEIDAQLYQDEAQAGGTHNGELIIDSGGTVYLGPLYITGKLSIYNTMVILEGTVYVAGEIVVQDGQLIGAATIVAEGKVNLQMSGYDSENIPLIMSVNSDIVCQSGSTIGGVLYAPNGKIDVQGADMYGVLAGAEVLVQSSTITYPLNPNWWGAGEVNILTHSIN